MNLNNNKKTILNLTSSLIFFGLQLIINFFLTPFIVKNIGVEANGFIALGNNFISFASLATIAVSSMSSRFITISFEKENKEKAHTYYTSSIVGSILVSSIVLIISLFLILFLEKIIEIPTNLVNDVKILFGLLFLNFSLSNAFSTIKVATFATNNLYLDSFRDAQAQVLRVITLLLAFSLFIPRVYYVGIGALVATVFTVFFSIYYKKKLMPELSINRKYFDWSALKEMVSSGSWNIVANVGVNLLNGFDLLIANLFLGPTAMGILSLSKTVPTVITQLSSKVTHVFTPVLTLDYARNDNAKLIYEIKKAMKITLTLVTIPVTIFIVFGIDFYRLWLPSENALVLQLLSIISIFGYIFTSGIQVINQIFTVFNKLKIYSLSILISGVVNIILVLILVNNTNLGVFAVVGVSSIVNLIRYFFVILPLASKYLQVKRNIFYPEVGYSILSTIIISSLGFLLRNYLPHDSWLSLFVSVLLMAIIGIIVNFLLVLSNDERKGILGVIRRD